MIGDRKNHRADSPSRAAFTLIELLVSITILLILLGLAVGTLSVLNSSEKPRSSARQIQSYLEGARNRAAFAKQPAGVRFVIDRSGNTSSSMISLGSPGIEEGRLNIDATGMTLTWVDGRNWNTLANGAALAPGSRIKIPNDSTGVWYPIADVSFERDASTFEFIRIFEGLDDEPGEASVDDDGVNGTDDLGEMLYPGTDDFIGFALAAADVLTLATPFKGSLPVTNVTYKLELQAQPVPNTDPMPLASGIVVELDPARDIGRLPSSWFGSSGYVSLDVMFSPNGTVTGPAAAGGLIYFVLTDVRDYEMQLKPGDPERRGDTYIVSLATRTGNISTHPVNRDDPLKWHSYAETGATAR